MYHVQNLIHIFEMSIKQHRHVEGQLN